MSSNEIEDMIKNIKSRSWYRQGGSICIGFAYPPYCCIPDMLGPNTLYGIQKFNHNEGYFDKGVERVKADEYLNKYLKDSDWLKNSIKKWKVLLRKQCILLKKLINAPIAKNDVSKLSQEYLDAAIKAWSSAVIIEVYDPWGEMILRERTSKYSLTPEELNIMTQPKKFSYVQQELIDRYNLAKKPSKAGILNHYKKYYWIETSWQHATILSEKHFTKAINDAKKNIDELKSSIEDIYDHHDLIQKQQKEITRRQKFDSETLKIFRFFSELSDWRDLRKQEHACKTNHDTWLLMEKIAKHNKISTELASTITVFDLKTWKLSKELLSELQTRMIDDSCFTYNHEKLQKWYGDDARKLKQALEVQMIGQFSEIKGMNAYSGIIQGRVRIINSIKDFSKMIEGDVLVSIMTRPELVPAMKKASAIVTDEGGITCHAAIISRELKKPCIVGTQIATQVLKDGDLVEVDANHGTIKLIK